MGIQVPKSLKRALTSLQIAQFLWGATYAAAHLFIKYDIPVSTPYQIAHTIQNAASSVSSAVSAASSTASKVIESPLASGTMAAVLKKLLLRAVGEEGVAERVENSAGEWIAAEPIKQHILQAEERVTQYFETRYHTDLTKVDCIDTTGEAFAIYLNLLYLLPLTLLFARFFIKAYTARGKSRTASQAARQVAQSGKEAAEKTEDQVDNAGTKAEDKLDAEAQKRSDQLRRDVQSMKEGTFSSGRRVSDHVSSLESKIKTGADKMKEQGRKLIDEAGSPRRQSPAKRQQEKPEEKVESKNEPVFEEDEEEKSKSAPKSEKQQDEPKTEKSEQQEETGSGLLSQTPSKNNDGQKTPKTESESTAGSAPASAQHEAPEEEDNDKENQPPAHIQPAPEQEAALAETQPTRPGESVEGATEKPLASETKADDEEDTDAMGKSGAIVDFAAEKARETTAEAAQAAKEE